MARKPKQDSDQNIISDSNKSADPAKGNEVAHPENGLPENGAAKFAEAEYRSRCGGALRLAREKQGLSTRDVANQLRLSVKQIEAIESDHFAALPEPTIVKGFIRNYAKFLKVPVEPLLDAYLVIVPNKTHHSLTIQPASSMRLSNSSQSAGTGRYLWLLFAVLLAIGLWFFYQGYIQKPSPVVPTTELKESLPEAALPMAERNNVPDDAMPPAANSNMTEPAATEANPADTAAATSPTTPASESLPTDQKIQVQTNNPPTNAATVSKPAIEAEKTSANKPDYRLEFNASQETWVSVVDATQKEVYNKILFPGNREVIDAKPPLNIIVGNSHGATLTVNNQAVDLAPHTRINVARLRVD